MNITKKLITRIAEDICDDPAYDIGWSGAVDVHQIVERTLDEAVKLHKDAEQIMAVRAKTSGNYDPVIGYATGTEQDIEAYFEDRKEYGLSMVAITPVAVPSGFAAHRDNIVAKRDRLQAEVNELNRRLDEKDIHQ